MMLMEEPQATSMSQSIVRDDDDATSVALNVGSHQTIVNCHDLIDTVKFC